MVATYDLHFLDIFVGWPGRSHDAKVFHNNPLYRNLPGRLHTGQNQRLIEMYYIVADAAYTLSPQVLTPFRKPINRDLNEVETTFNSHLSSKRNVHFYVSPGQYVDTVIVLMQVLVGYIEIHVKNTYFNYFLYCNCKTLFIF